ncbi:hypothetical protein A2714_04710 [Candidatus Woesebacteria bacterium RIFCSPHIGHO2_01_FULL_38_9]|uniref:Glycosidase n=2 Tax=Candidatus Woeseibacteriota TaxID=1752722 RepID=A0A1F7Y057_9BACT|nr:MAG: hypothetical protein A2714_04710 [Candidatus Woesebacteria bacterium RIFCSPHIGHO2_01_FULL_38_9]OGM58848.1 MAG: hypothetical protein A3A75_06310 [Candidatus Woesebacteria bacterium RIFCSPLOWO2_01_FULL_39_10]
MKLARSPKNPILQTTGNGWESKAVMNCAVFEYEGKINLLYRAQGEENVSYFGLARLSSPDTVEERLSTPVFSPEPKNKYESSGVEDPRVTKINDTFYVVYTAASRVEPIPYASDLYEREGWRIRVSLATTQDFKVFSRSGVIIRDVNSKNGALFPEKIGGKFYLLHRISPSIKLATSQDGVNYKDVGEVFGPRQGSWDSFKVGAGGPPIKTKCGWLLFYHGLTSERVYRLGIVFLDLNDPTKVLARTTDPILEPKESYEKEGLVNNVVFSCGAIEKNNEYLVYYGAGDKVVCLATIDKEKVLKWAKKQVGKFKR